MDAAAIVHQIPSAGRIYKGSVDWARYGNWKKAQYNGEESTLGHRDGSCTLETNELVDLSNGFASLFADGASSEGFPEDTML